jgi:undecaprenyl-diphosphatase
MPSLCLRIAVSQCGHQGVIRPQQPRLSLVTMASPVDTSRIAAALARMDQAELRLCITFNRVIRQVGVRWLFQVVSRLGDGIVWYALIFALPVAGGRAAIDDALRMAIAGLAGLLLYKLLKRHLVRERPFITHKSIVRAGAPLDRFSFPSGHTLHAVCFAMLAIEAYPVLAWVLIPLALMIALSRIVLGLHYPSDVLAGAALGAGIAQAASLLPLP